MLEKLVVILKRA